MNTKYPWDRKDVKYILNILYNNKGVYGSERYKDLMKRLIQVLYKKVDLGETFYQAIYREIREEMGLHIAPVYLIIDKSFNCNLYTTDIGERIL